MKKYNITSLVFEAIIYLYDEGFFVKQRYMEIDVSASYRAEVSFKGLLKNGWLTETQTVYKGRFKVYRRSGKAARMVTDFYSLLEGKEIPIGDLENPTIKKRCESTRDKRYLEMIKMMERKRAKARLRRHPLE